MYNDMVTLSTYIYLYIQTHEYIQYIHVFMYMCKYIHNNVSVCTYIHTCIHTVSTHVHVYKAHV